MKREDSHNNKPRKAQNATKSGIVGTAHDDSFHARVSKNGLKYQKAEGHLWLCFPDT